MTSEILYFKRGIYHFSFKYPINNEKYMSLCDNRLRHQKLVSKHWWYSRRRFRQMKNCEIEMHKCLFNNWNAHPNWVNICMQRGHKIRYRGGSIEHFSSINSTGEAFLQ